MMSPSHFPCCRVGAALLLFATALSASTAHGFVLQSGLSAAEAVESLSKDIGRTVELRGGNGRRLPGYIGAGTREQRVARVAAQLEGKWRRVLIVAPSQSPPTTPKPLEVLEEPVTLGFSDLPAARAFAITARQLNADLVIPPTITQRVSLDGVSRTTRELLDELALRANARWELTYRIEAPDTEELLRLTQPEPPRRPAAEIRAPATRAKPVPPPPAPMRTAAPTLAPPKEWSLALRREVHDLVKAAPDRRDTALQSFMTNVTALGAPLASLDAAQRRTYRNAGERVWRQWTRLFTGLAPTLRQQLQPADRLLRDLVGD